MKSRLSTLVITAALAPLAAMPLAAGAKPVHGLNRLTARPLGELPLAGPVYASSVKGPANEVVVSIGRGQLVSLPGSMKDVFVADDKIADVQVKSNHQLYVYGRASGETSIYASDAAGQVIWSANVRVGSNIDSVDQMLKVAMPDAHVSVATMGTNTVLLTGTVANPEDSAEATRLVQSFVGKETNVISRLKTATPLQVMLKVRIAEVSRTYLKSLGVNLTSTSSGGNGFQYAIGQGRSASSNSTQYYPSVGLGVGTTPYGYVNIPANATATNPTGATSVAGAALSTLAGSTTIGMMGHLFGLDILGSLDAGETAGLVTTLAEPNLTALSGETADFLAGGEYPYPSSSGLGAVSVEYKKYGVSLAYTPIVLADGRISMRVRPEVSEIDTSHTLTMAGYTVYALTTRRAETTVELGSGQSFMIAGLMSNSAQNAITKMPGAGDIPILGTLFKSTSFQKGESELVIVVTPYLVKPANANDIRLPTDGLETPNEIQRVLGNMVTAAHAGEVPKPKSVDVPGAHVGLSDGPAAAPASAAPASAPAPSAKSAAAPQAPGFSVN